MAHDDRDIVIVGGGPAGATTALAIARAAPDLAARVVVLERAIYPRDKPCAGALGARGDALLRQLGVEIDVPGVPVDGISFRGRYGEAAARPGRIGRVVRRVEFDHALVRAAAVAGAEVRDGVRVGGVRADGAGGATVETNGGTLHARVVIGCDGVGSVVRKSLGAGAGTMRAQVIEVDTDPAPGDVDRALLHFDATDARLEGYAWDFPTLVDGQPLVCRGIYRLRVQREDERPAGDRDLGEQLSDRLAALGVDPTRSKNKRYAERGFEITAPLARGCTMLAGEAAGIDPVTGEGIAQAIEFGGMAGRFVARALSRGSGGPVVLDEWPHEVARSRLGRDLRLRVRMMRLFYGSRRDEVERWLAESSDPLFVGCQHFAAQPYDWLKVADVVGRGAALLLASRLAGVLRR